MENLVKNEQKAKTALKVLLSDIDGKKDSFKTEINLSLDQAKRYYVGKIWNIGNGEHDYYMYCYDIEEIKI